MVILVLGKDLGYSQDVCHTYNSTLTTCLGTICTIFSYVGGPVNYYLHTYLTLYIRALEILRMSYDTYFCIAFNKMGQIFIKL